MCIPRPFAFWQHYAYEPFLNNDVHTYEIDITPVIYYLYTNRKESGPQMGMKPYPDTLEEKFIMFVRWAGVFRTRLPRMDKLFRVRCRDARFSPTIRYLYNFTSLLISFSSYVLYTRILCTISLYSVHRGNQKGNTPRLET